MKQNTSIAGATIQRMKLLIRGAVQGVGFRPFIYRLATRYKLNGFVSNSVQGVVVEVEGSKPQLDRFLLRIDAEKPVRSFIQGMECSVLDAKGYTGFVIQESDGTGPKQTIVQSDIATCAECIEEIFTMTNRRYLYPFTNCTHCGPRYSIIEGLPYDRRNTSMKKFEMCDECQAEYDDPRDRRFHAQPNACPRCGPHLQLWSDGALSSSSHFEALHLAAKKIRDGEIVAVKGLGGFHLVVDARNEAAVVRLRSRKHREAKPLAVMFPSLDAIKNECEVSELEERLLISAESPIVLLKRKVAIANSSITSSVAPNNPYLGSMIPYTPLHHILMRKLGFPVVATSGNLSDEPICVDEHEALDRLKDIADAYLVHNRPIVRHVDDSVVRVVLGREQVLRRARGYAPLPISVDLGAAPFSIAVGAHQKNTVAVTSPNNVVISQHIGDLQTREAYNAFSKVTDDLQRLFDIKPQVIISDMHPDYLSTQFAKQSSLPLHQVQHHYAHVASCMAENELDGQVLGVSWDGTGYGLDGTVWGGEFLLTKGSSFDRVGTFRHLPLPGGAKSVKEPRRTALGLLYEILGDAVFEMRELAPVDAFSREELSVIEQMLTRKLNSPTTSSVGRLFDTVASIINLRQLVSFEGQAAMELEFALDDSVDNSKYEYHIGTNLLSGNTALPEMVVDWSPMIVNIVHDRGAGESNGTIARRFHNTLVEIIVDVAKMVNEQRIILTGGCFQNKYLNENAVRRLREEGFKPYWHQRVPANDGGISLGQVYSYVRSVRASNIPNEDRSAISQIQFQSLSEVHQ